MSHTSSSFRFGIASSNEKLHTWLKVVIERTFFDSVVHALNPDRTKLEDYNVLFVDSSTALVRLRATKSHRQSKIVWVPPRGGAREHHAFHVDGLLSPTPKQAEIRELLCKLLELPEELPFRDGYLKPDDILYCTSNKYHKSRTYLKLHKEIIWHGRNIGELTKRLTPYGFVRVDKGATANRRYIKRKIPVQGTVKLIMDDGVEFMAAKIHKKDILAG